MQIQCDQHNIVHKIITILCSNSVKTEVVKAKRRVVVTVTAAADNMM